MLQITTEIKSTLLWSIIHDLHGSQSSWKFTCNF